MKKKYLMILGIVILLIALITVLFIVNKNNQILMSTNKDENIILDTSNEKRITSIIEDITIQGIVEIKTDRTICILGGQHFGELGYEMEEYTTTNIENKNQTCIDYMTLEEYDASYIEIGDIVICTGDKICEIDFSPTNYFDTKENKILVLKNSDYSKMIDEALKKEIPIISTIEDIQGEERIYLKYDIQDKKNSNIEYHFPFVKIVYKTDNTEVIGEIKEGKRVKIEYRINDAKDQYAGNELKLIKVIE